MTAPGPVQWRISDDLQDYPSAVRFMQRRAADIRDGSAPETVWLLEHPPLYTAGTSAGEGEVLETGGLPVYETGRGGRMTYHGPGQRVAYVMLDLKRRSGDVRRFVHDLEAWLIATLAHFNVVGERRPGRVGIWVRRGRRPTRRRGRTRWPPSASGSAAGSAPTGWPSTSSPSSTTSGASSPAASRSTG